MAIFFEVLCPGINTAAFTNPGFFALMNTNGGVCNDKVFMLLQFMREPQVIGIYKGKIG